MKIDEGFGLTFCSAILRRTGFHHQNSGVPEFCHFTWTQIGKIRFAMVRPEGRLSSLRCGAGLAMSGTALAHELVQRHDLDGGGTENNHEQYR
jgi:hypothetical protein